MRKTFKIKGLIPPGARVYTKLPDDHPLYNAVGRVASSWARLEQTLDETIVKLLDVPKFKVFCITSQMLGHAPRLRAIISLVQLTGCDDKIISKLNGFLGNSHSLSDKRNRIVHDPLYRDWQTPNAEGAAQFRVTTKKRPDFGFRSIDIDFANSVVKEIDQHIGRFKEIRKELYAELEALRKKSSGSQSEGHQDRDR